MVTVQHVRRACSWEAGGQQHRVSAWARIVGQASVAAKEVVARAHATRMASSRCIQIMIAAIFLPRNRDW